MCVCVCVRVCPISNPSNPDNSLTAWDMDLKFGTPVKQSQPSNRDYFHDSWCPICDFMGFWIFWKKSVAALTCLKFELSSSNYTQIYYIEQGTLVLNLAKSIEAFKFFQILNFLRIFSKLSNSGKFRFIELKFCA